MTPKNSKISIIGGAGFIGTRLCHLLTTLARDFEILDLKISRDFPDKSKIVDITNMASIRSNLTGDVVIHLAAVHRDDVRDHSQYERVNVVGTSNIARACSELGIKKIVFTSTVAVYGFAPEGTGEDGAINPFNEYGKTKYKAETMLVEWNKDEGNSLSIIRPTAVFGVGNRGNVYNLFNQIANRKFLMIGSGENKKSIAYVENLVDFLKVCADSDEKYIIANYVDSPALTMNQLVAVSREKLFGIPHEGLHIPYPIGLFVGYFFDIVSLVFRRSFAVSAIRIKKFVASSDFSSNKHRVEGFVAPFDLRSALARTLADEFIAPDPNREIFYTE